MPCPAWTVNRFPPDLSRDNDLPPVLVQLLRLRHFLMPFPVTRTTLAFDQRSLRLFEASPCRAASEGLPPSLAQHRAELDSSSTLNPPSRVHGAQSSAKRTNLSWRFSSSLSNSCNITFDNHGDRGPPCGVPSSVSCTTPSTITPEFKNIRISFRSRLSCTRFAANPIKIS